MEVHPHQGIWSRSAWLVAAALAPTTAPSVPDFATDSPDGVMRRFESAYERRRLDDFSALFTKDFRFYFADPDLVSRYPDGWTREDEIASADHLFHGFTDRAGIRRPAARRIELGLDPFTVEPDPEKPDSVAWYRVVVVPAVDLRVWLEGDLGVDVVHDRHEFWMVRGDAARLEPGQDGDADHWYIRRWVEKLPDDSVARTYPALREGSDADPDSPTVADVERGIAR